MWHHFYIGLVWQNCFAHSVLVLIALSIIGSDKIEQGLLNSFLFCIFWSAIYDCPSKQILTDSVTINIIHIQKIKALDIKSNHYKWTFQNCLQKLMFSDVLQNRSSLKCPNIHRKTPVLDSLFDKVAGLQTSNFIKKWLRHRCFPVNVANFLRTVFSIEHLQ